MMEYIGNMIFSLREEIGVSQKSLARGILSISELSRIERGEKETSKILLEALFQRLGKSIDKFEIIVSGEEYNIIFLRSLILKNMIDKKYQIVNNLLKMYEKYANTKSLLHKQYLLQMRAINEYINKKNKTNSIQMLGQVLSITFPEWKRESWSGFYLCTQEVQLVLLINYLMIECGDIELSKNMLEKLLEYIDIYYTDDEEKARVYPKCMWLLGKVYFFQGKIEEAYQMYRKAKMCLIRNGIFTLIYELLNMEYICLEKLNRKIEKDYIEKQKKAVEFVYCMIQGYIPEETILYLLSINQQNEIVISNELIKELRLSKNLSQEELSENICTRETLSRIENGRRSPNQKNLYKMLQKMELERERYYSFIITDDYRLYEKVRLFKRNFFQENKNVAYTLLKEIEEKLDLKNPLNKQFIESSWLIKKTEDDSINLEQIILEFKKVLCYTMKKFNGTIYRVPFRQEFVILNQIALCMRQIGKNKEAISLYEQILNEYENSKVLEQHHAISKMLLYINYALLLEENNELEKSKKIGKQGIKLAIECGRGDIIGVFLGNLACLYEKRKCSKDRELGECYLRNSYYFLCLYEQDKDSIIIKKYYEKKYKRDLSNKNLFL